MSISFQGNTEAERAIELIKHTEKSVFLTGKAGTGKSTLLRHIISDLDKNYVLLAPTGIAALNINGQTIHSFFRFQFRPYLSNDTHLPDFGFRIELLSQLDLIVIDEISMVRADLMNAIDLTLKSQLGNQLPFGGKQLLLVGDLFQLPPVLINSNHEEVEIINANYATKFFFSAKIFEFHPINIIELQKVYRQEDQTFINILNNIRVNNVDDADLAKINSRVVGLTPNETDGIITLTTTNAKVKDINSQKLAQINQPLHQFVATQSGTFLRGNSSSRVPTDVQLQLKEGAQIMFVKNDRENRWVNGTIGSIAQIDGEEITVQVGSLKYIIDREIWEDIRYKWNREENKVDQDLVGTFKQYPIRLAWAVTIHKSQGQTFEKAIIDLHDRAFAEGQAYVALSRCTSLEGLFLTRAIRHGDIIVSQQVINYLSRHGVDSLQQKIEEPEIIQQSEVNVEQPSDYKDKIQRCKLALKQVRMELQQGLRELTAARIELEKIKSQHERLNKEKYTLENNILA